MAHLPISTLSTTTVRATWSLAGPTRPTVMKYHMYLESPWSARQISSTATSPRMTWCWVLWSWPTGLTLLKQGEYSPLLSFPFFGFPWISIHVRTSFLWESVLTVNDIPFLILVSKIAPNIPTVLTQSNTSCYLHCPLRVNGRYVLKNYIKECSS